MFRFALAPLLLALTAQAETPDNVSSRLMVHIPHKLFRDVGYNHREALFGVPPYGGSIAQNVYYADNKLCDSNVDTTKGYPKRPNNEPWPSPFILMIDRGECTFVQKVRNAQMAGAAGVIIADTTCLCADKECITANQGSQCESAEPIMADDGSGGDVTIPSFLMFKRDADLIKDEVMVNQPVQIEMSWSLPTPDDRVEYDLWTVPTDVVSKDFLLNFKDLAIALGDRAYFTPHQYIYDGIKTHCQGNDGENFCYNLCTNNGRYCATDPDNDLDKGISGADVVTESLRRLCIWSDYGDEDGIGEKYWSYISEFVQRCNTPDYFSHQDCLKDAFKHAGIDYDQINRCMADSGGLEKDGQNSRLDEELAAQNERGVVVLPTAFVNTAAIRGQLSSSNVFKAICSGYAEGTKPAVCDTCSGCMDPSSCVKSGVCTSGSNAAPAAALPEGSVSTHTFATSMLFVMALFGGIGYWHYNKTREDMRDQVRGILADYMPLDDSEAGSGGGNSPMDFARRGGTTSLIS